MSNWDREAKIERREEGRLYQLTKPDSEILWISAELIYCYQHGVITQAALCNWLVQLWQVDYDGPRPTEAEVKKTLADARIASWRVLKK